jgi:hypothetical protein
MRQHSIFKISLFYVFASIAAALVNSCILILCSPLIPYPNIDDPEIFEVSIVELFSNLSLFDPSNLIVFFPMSLACAVSFGGVMAKISTQNPKYKNLSFWVAAGIAAGVLTWVFLVVVLGDYEILSPLVVPIMCASSTASAITFRAVWKKGLWDN